MANILADIKNTPLKIVFRLEDKVNGFLKNTIGNVDSDGRRNSTYDKLYVSRANLDILYGLPKVHKNNHPIRPFYQHAIPLDMVLVNIWSP